MYAFLSNHFTTGNRSNGMRCELITHDEIHPALAVVIGSEKNITVKRRLQKTFPGSVLSGTGSAMPAFISFHFRSSMDMSLEPFVFMDSISSEQLV